VSLTEVGPDTWDERVLAASGPVLVDVWAPWCVPCRRVEPIIAEAAARYGDRLECVRLNADEATDLVGRYQILTLPTVILFTGGAEAGRIRGVPKPKKLSGLIDSVISSE